MISVFTINKNNSFLLQYFRNFFRNFNHWVLILFSVSLCHQASPWADQSRWVAVLPGSPRPAQQQQWRPAVSVWEQLTAFTLTFQSPVCFSAVAPPSLSGVCWHPLVVCYLSMGRCVSACKCTRMRCSKSLNYPAFLWYTSSPVRRNRRTMFYMWTHCSFMYHRTEALTLWTSI